MRFSISPFGVTSNRTTDRSTARRFADLRRRGRGWRDGQVLPVTGYRLRRRASVAVLVMGAVRFKLNFSPSTNALRQTTGTTTSLGSSELSSTERTFKLPTPTVKHGGANGVTVS